MLGGLEGMLSGIGTGISGQGAGGMLDLVLLGSVVLGGIQGFMRGGVELLFSMTGGIAGLWVASMQAPKGADFLQGYVTIPDQAEPLVGFIAVFILVQLVARSVALGIGSLMGVLGMGTLNQLAGIAVGSFKAALVASVLLALGGEMGLPGPQTKAESNWYSPVRSTLPVTWSAAQEIFPGIGQLSNAPDRILRAIGDRAETGAPGTSLPKNADSLQDLSRELKDAGKQFAEKVDREDLATRLSNARGSR